MTVLVLGIQAWKFGSPWETGYSQFEPGAFSLLPRGEALAGFLVRPDRSLPVHAPMLLLALPGWVGFLRRHRVEALFIGLGTLLLVGFVSTFANWPGHWCYGPRYLLVLVPLLSLPLLPVLDRLAAERRPILRAVLIALLAVSAGLQKQVVGKRFFLAYEVSGLLAEAGVPNAPGLTTSRNFALLYRELDRFARCGSEGRVVRHLRRELAPDAARDLENRLRAQLAGNYFWLLPIEPGSTLRAGDG